MTLQAGSCWGAVGSTRVTRAQVFELQFEWFSQPTWEVAGWCTPGGRLSNSDAPGLENGFLLEMVALHGQQVVDTLRNALQVTRWTSCYGCNSHKAVWSALVGVEGTGTLPSTLFTYLDCVIMPKTPGDVFSRLLKEFLPLSGKFMQWDPYCFLLLPVYPRENKTPVRGGSSRGHQKGTTPDHFCPWVCRTAPFPMSGAYHPVWLQELP